MDTYPTPVGTADPTPNLLVARPAAPGVDPVGFPPTPAPAAVEPATPRHRQPTEAPAAQVEGPIRLALANGHGQVTVLMQPEELGRINLRIARAPDGSVRLTLTAERPDTARRLLVDQPALHAALDRAGLSADRVVTVRTEAPSDPTAYAGGGTPGSPNNPSGDARPRQPPDPRPGFAGRPEVPTANPAARPPGSRAGVDITA